MTKYLWISIGAGVLALMLFGLWLWNIWPTAPSSQNPPSSASQGPYSTGNTYSAEPPSSGPSATTTSQVIQITGQGSTSLAVKDFIHNGETAADVVNPGLYYLAGPVGYCLANGECPSGAKDVDFSIIYNSADDSFNIVLLTEPMGQVRQDAERFLEDRLGVGEAALCALNYTVGASFWVNPIYAGKNLGFSFCPGATPL